MHFSLRKITVSNFRSVRQPVSLDFTTTTPGLYFVRGINDEGARLGSNGAGKSTLFVDAFYWVLTGRITRSTRPGSDVENWKAAKQPTEVVVEFSLDDEIHEVRRTRNPNGLDLNGERVEQSKVDDLLPLTDSALRRSVFIDQFGDMFLSLRPEDKSRIFSETLGLDTWIAASDRAGSEVTGIQQTITEIEKKLVRNEASLSEARQQREAAVVAEEGFEEELKGKLAAARKRARELSEEAAEARKALDKAREAFGRQKGDVVKREVNALRTKHREVVAAFARLGARVQGWDSELTRLKKQLNSYAGNVRLCPECKQPVSDKHIKEQTDKLLKERARIAGLIADAVPDGVELEKESAKLEAEIQEKETSLDIYNQFQTANAVAAERSIAADRASNQAKAEVDRLKNQKNPYTEQCDALEIRIEDLKKTKEKLAEDLEEYNQELEVYKFWQRGFREIRLEQIDATLLELELAANAHAESLGLEGWEIGFATEREKKTGGVAHAFSVFLYPPNQPEPISWESYSGGESQRWQLATTFGLAEVLLARSGISTDFEVLDEPTHHLSPEGFDDLLACLSDRAQELKRRIFVIDHHALDRGMFDGVVTVVKDKRTGSRIEDTGGVLRPAARKERVKL